MEQGSAKIYNQSEEVSLGTVSQIGTDVFQGNAVKLKMPSSPQENYEIMFVESSPKIQGRTIKDAFDVLGDQDKERLYYEMARNNSKNIVVRTNGRLLYVNIISDNGQERTIIANYAKLQQIPNTGQMYKMAAKLDKVGTSSSDTTVDIIVDFSDLQICNTYDIQSLTQSIAQLSRKLLMRYDKQVKMSIIECEKLNNQLTEKSKNITEKEEKEKLESQIQALNYDIEYATNVAQNIGYILRSNLHPMLENSYTDRLDINDDFDVKESANVNYEQVIGSIRTLEDKILNLRKNININKERINNAKSNEEANDVFEKNRKLEKELKATIEQLQKTNLNLAKAKAKRVRKNLNPIEVK